MSNLPIRRSVKELLDAGTTKHEMPPRYGFNPKTTSSSLTTLPPRPPVLTMTRPRQVVDLGLPRPQIPLRSNTAEDMIDNAQDQIMRNVMKKVIEVGQRTPEEYARKLKKKKEAEEQNAIVIKAVSGLLNQHLPIPPPGRVPVVPVAPASALALGGASVPALGGAPALALASALASASASSSSSAVPFPALRSPAITVVPGSPAPSIHFPHVPTPPATPASASATPAVAVSVPASSAIPAPPIDPLALADLDRSMLASTTGTSRGDKQYGMDKLRVIAGVLAKHPNMGVILTPQSYGASSKKTELVPLLQQYVSAYDTWLANQASASASAGSSSASASAPGISGSGVLIGKSVSQAISDRVYLDLDKLNFGVLSLSTLTKHGTKKKLLGFKNRELSDVYREALIAVLRDRRIPDLSELDEEERKHFYRVISLSTLPIENMTPKQLEHLEEAKQTRSHISTDSVANSTLKKLKSRLTLLIGQMNSGNDSNPIIQTEVQAILTKFIKMDVMTHAEATSFVKKYVK